ncbi:HAD family hydrolase [Paenibacillus eucommiae]|uniref:FMN phosphatase YigB (HAD superfamily) n=1 Tax=Paenibacillus eucommiae TaxID=1355755 RepID=A0ABS4J9B5_9BACL|nr:HAD family hydrolase [Paenibacillus eucommiae]MBP1995666.1 FMN phosphatase YigB (HAD superfamily) [Paenibacillus eucommiae]
MLHLKNGEVSPDNLELWKTDVFLNQIANRLLSVRLLSLDIFDTLLLRACSVPADVFELTAEKAAAAGIWKRPVSADEFREIRIGAEWAARRRLMEPRASSYEEVTLEQIYAEVPDVICDTQRMLELELEAERQVCFLNPHMLSLIHWCKHSGIRVALVSDMYLSSVQLTDLLQSAGLNMEQIDVLLVSNEQQVSKVTGGLFDRLLEHFTGLSPQDIVHIGDNTAADIAGAASRNIEALYYPVIPEHFDSPFHWDSIRHGNMLPALKSLRKLAGSSGAREVEDPQERAFFRFGAASLGPFLHGWCEWVIDTCIRENRTAVHPLMREGYLLAPMLEAAARMRGAELTVKPVYLSRQSTYLAALERFEVSDLERLLELDWVKVGDVFSMLDIVEEAGPYQPYLDLSVAQCSLIPDASSGSVTESLRQYIMGERTQQKVEASIERNRKLFVDYLLQEFGSPERMVTVDIGFNGTIQKAMEAALRLTGLPYGMLHLLAVGTGKIAESLLTGMDIRSFVGSCGGNSDLGFRIARSPAFLEELMMGDFGSTLRYEKDANGFVQPVLAELQGHTAEELRCKRACQRGVLAFQQYYAYLNTLKPELLAALSDQPREWTKPFHRVIDMPTPEEASMLGELTHQENFGGLQISPICNEVDDHWFEQGEEAFIDYCNYGPAMFNAFWPQGMVTLKSPYYLYAYYLRQQSLFGSESLCFALIRKVKEAGHQSFHVYGTGAFADLFVRQAGFHGLKMESLIDSGPSGRKQEQQPDQELDQHQGQHRDQKLGQKQNHPIYVIASLSRIQTLRQAIEDKYRNSGITPIIYDLFPYQAGRNL